MTEIRGARKSRSKSKAERVQQCSSSNGALDAQGSRKGREEERRFLGNAGLQPGECPTQHACYLRQVRSLWLRVLSIGLWQIVYSIARDGEYWMAILVIACLHASFGFQPRPCVVGCGLGHRALTCRGDFCERMNVWFACHYLEFCSADVGTYFRAFLRVATVVQFSGLH